MFATEQAMFSNVLLSGTQTEALFLAREDGAPNDSDNDNTH